jgi:hypothetical protein
MDLYFGQAGFGAEKFEFLLFEVVDANSIIFAIEVIF